MRKMQKYLLTVIVVLSMVAYTPPGTTIKFIDGANMDLSVKPGDNFYLYVNGNWIKNNPVPASKTRWGSFDVLREQSSHRIQGLLEEAAASTSASRLNQMVGDFYLSGIDSATLEKLGYDPIKMDLQRIDTISTITGLLNEITYDRIYNSTGALFGFNIGPDDKNVTKYIPNFDQGGTSLPDRDYYIKSDKRSITVRTAYAQHLSNSFILIGESQSAAASHANAVLRIETALAKAQLTRVELRNPDKTYNKLSVKDFTAMTPSMDWNDILIKSKVNGADSILTNNPSFFKTIDLLLSAVSIDDWKTYLKWKIINRCSPYLSDAFVKEDFAFRHVLTGQKQMLPRAERISNELDGDLGDMVGQLYVAKYFKPEAKQRMQDLVNNLMETFGERINKLDWMSTETKAKAMEKLNAITKKIAFPDKWKDYQGVTITKNDYFGNVRRSATWNYYDRISRFGKPVDKTIWGMTPPTINAYYNPAYNEIVFPAGILQYPFFDFEADDAVNYGGIAAVIGHEMTHGFDDEGRKYAADGNLKDWWTKDDAASFDRRANQVVTQYNGFAVLDTLHVNGKLTLGENLADLGGLTIAYEAFTKTQQFKEGKKIDGFTPTQRFFINWAQVWRNNILPEMAANSILTDPHSPGLYRANGPVSNLDPWYDAFNVKEGDKMYKPKSERIAIW
jgi:putative endopeptidase